MVAFLVPFPRAFRARQETIKTTISQRYFAVFQPVII
jgi:hypothetical protein